MTLDKDLAPMPPRQDVPYGAVDAWLRQQLASRYDRALEERVPQEMLALLAEVP